MKKTLAAAGLGAALTLGSLLGAGTASASIDPAVCDGIDEAYSYRSYLIGANAMSIAIGYDQEEQAYNIVNSIRAYCPWHLAGIRMAAAALS